MDGPASGHTFTLHAHNGTRFDATTFDHSTDPSGRRQMTNSIRVGSVDCCGDRLQSVVFMHWKDDDISGGTRGGIRVPGWDSMRMAVIKFVFEVEECGQVKESNISVEFPNNFAEFK